MQSLKLDLLTFDVGLSCEGPEAFASRVVRMVRESWGAGADIVMLPEFTWMGLERFVSGDAVLEGVAELFWHTLWPGIRSELDHPDRAVVLGTVPCVGVDGRLRNRSPILASGGEIHQDKIHLTPWECAFSPGEAIRIWEFRGARVAVVICLDIEIPEISAALRGHHVDLILVPSATESLLGVERVGRCASARAVELGCHVAVCHLVGKTASTLVDENTGRLAVYHPSQSPFGSSARMEESMIHDSGFHRMMTTLNMQALANLRNLSGETDPSKIRPSAMSVDDR